MFPDQEILVFDERRLTYGAAVGERPAASATRCARSACGRGDRVGVLQTNSRPVRRRPTTPTAAIGAVFVPLNYRAKPPELEYMIDTASIKVLLVGDRYRRRWSASCARGCAACRRYVALDTPRDGMPHARRADRRRRATSSTRAEVDDDDTTILMYTSGTTSLPEGRAC